MFEDERTTVEERTDVYHPHSAAVGVKERGIRDGGGSAGLEMKLRKDVDEQGFEKWKKSKFSGEAELSQALIQGGRGELNSSKEPTATVVKLAKSRRQQAAGAGASTEDTDLLVTPSTRVNADRRRPAVVQGTGSPRAPGSFEQDSDSGGEPEVWRTVAIEGKRKACSSLLATVPPACRALACDGEVFVCGYPEFVCAVAQRYESSDRGRQRREHLMQDLMQDHSQGAARFAQPLPPPPSAKGPAAKKARPPTAAQREESITAAHECNPCTGRADDGCTVF